jgi:hypothetical protein
MKARGLRAEQRFSSRHFPRREILWETRTAGAACFAAKWLI